VANLAFGRGSMRLTNHVIFWVIVAYFFGAASYFTYRVETVRAKLIKSQADIQFPSGLKVKVVNIMTGHQVAIDYQGAQVTVRILGIMSYPATVNDPMMENIARSSVRFLEKTILNQEVELVFEKFQKDRYNRVLAYVHSGNKDIGLEMVAQGFSLVYSRYDFSREQAYVKAELLAQKEKQGIWGVSAAAARSLQLKALWESEKAAEAKK
jgi:endonuclease YncB( thermonuclease family)